MVDKFHQVRVDLEKLSNLLTQYLKRFHNDFPSHGFYPGKV